MKTLTKNQLEEVRKVTKFIYSNFPRWFAETGGSLVGYDTTLPRAKHLIKSDVTQEVIKEVLRSMGNVSSLYFCYNTFDDWIDEELKKY